MVIIFVITLYNSYFYYYTKHLFSLLGIFSGILNFVHFILKYSGLQNTRLSVLLCDCDRTMESLCRIRNFSWFLVSQFLCQKCNMQEMTRKCIVVDKEQKKAKNSQYTTNY